MTSDLAVVVPVLSSLATPTDEERAFFCDTSAPSTQRAYRVAWADFDAWCRNQGLPSFPAPELLVARYAASLAVRSQAVSTINRALSAIAYVHRQHNIEWNRAHPAIARVMKNARHTLGVAPKNQKAPLEVDDLARIVAPLGNSLLELRDRAVLTIGYFGAYRRSELVGLDVRDVTRRPEGLCICLRKSKTDRDGKERFTGLYHQSDPRLCPVRALDTWLSEAQISSGPIFRSVDQCSRIAATALTPLVVARIVKDRCKAVGIDPRTVAGHSLRSGFATTAGRQGASLLSVATHLGHADIRTTAGYTRHATVFQDNPSRDMVSRAARSSASPFR